MSETIIISVNGENGESGIHEDDFDNAAFEVRASQSMLDKLDTTLISHLSFIDSERSTHRT
jgi:hypothetical protein